MKTNTTMKFGSLFTCGGGSSIGTTLAGLREVFACDLDNDVKNVFEANRKIFGNVPYLNKDVKNVSPEELLEVAGLEPGELDLLEASPPCKYITRINPKSRWDHPMNFLYRDVFKHMTPTGIYPKVVIMENVSSIEDPTFKPLLEKLLFDASQLNYHTDYEILDAKDYEVPQSRKRIIFIFVRKDIGALPSFPKPSGKLIPIIDVIPNIVGFKEANYNAAFRYKTDVCCTLTTGDSLDLHFDDHVRKPTIDERKKIMTFPEEYNLSGVSKKTALKLLGNAVPPKLMYHIVRHIKENILIPYYNRMNGEQNSK